MNRFTYRNNSSSFSNYDWTASDEPITNKCGKNPISEPTLIKKLRKFGNRSNPPVSVRVYLSSNNTVISTEMRKFEVGYSYPTELKAQEEFVEFISNYSITGNILGLNVVKARYGRTFLKIIVGETNDYSYSNITGDVISEIIGAIKW